MITAEEEFDHRVRELSLAFCNNRAVYEETMVTLSHFYRAHWDDACARIFVYHMIDKNYDEVLGVKKTAAHEVCEAAKAEFELANFWEGK